MKQYTHDLLGSRHTEVFHDTKNENHAPHYFLVAKAGEKDGNGVGEFPLQHVHFQNGPIAEKGVNGVNNEDLIAMVICRLEHFQQSPFSSRDNAMAITKLEEALMWLGKRTRGRINRGVEGTSKV